MRRVAVLPLGTFLCLGMVLHVAGQDDDVKAVVQKAIKAHGGVKNLAKQKAIHVKASGTLDFMNNLKFTTESFFQDPDKFKNVVDLEINNMNISVVQVFNGKRFWVSIMGKTMELKDKKDIDELRENLHAESLTNLVGLNAKGVLLSALGEVKINDRPAIGVRASSKGHRDVNLYFDKKSHMLVKSEARTVDFQSKQEVSQEKFYSDYREIDGIQQPGKLIIHQDGKRHITLDITSVKFLDRHEDSVFAEP